MLLQRRRLHARWLGRIEWSAAWDMQQALAQALKEERPGAQETLLLLEHPPVITLGRGARAEHVLVSDVPVVPTNRGGDVTYHGPGQLVAYPILDLRPDRCDVGRYMRDLEDVVIRTLAVWGIQATREAGLTGVWVGSRKIAAQGVHISRWVTCHGVALNVSPDLSHFHWIVPCGIVGREVTSMAELLGPDTPSVEEVARVLADQMSVVFDREVTG